jgi:catechol 2,3-dioxygenase-like lactoylglutathione lyase family enzyme
VASKLFPMLSCGDLARSLRFYGDLLGGVENYRFPENGDPAFIALTIGERRRSAWAGSRLNRSTDAGRGPAVARAHRLGRRS